MDATVNINLTDLKKLEAEVVTAQNDAARIKAELEAERARPADERLAQTYTFVAAAKEVIDYAVGNLSPEFSRGWPYEALRTIAKQVTLIGAVTDRDKERALLWNGFVEQIIERDREWALGKNVEARVSAVVADAIPKGPTKDEYLDAVARGQRKAPAFVLVLLGAIFALGGIAGAALLGLI